MAGKAVAVDPGSHTVKVMAVRDGKHGLEVTDYAEFPGSEGARGLDGTGIPLAGVVAGVAGRDMTLRYTQVPPAPDWQLRNLMELEISELSSQSGDELSADYNLLPPTSEEADSDTVLMALARNEALDRVATMVATARGSVRAHIPNCIAIYNAYLRTYTTDEDQVVCLANIGHETIDIALAKGQDLLFARNLSGGGKVLDDAIASAFNVSSRKAENLKKELIDLDPASRGKFASGQAEKVTMAAGGSASMIVSAIQSSLAFCKTQTSQPDLQLDKVLLCGGSARLRGVRGLLREALRCPVDLFDPFENVDLSSLSDGDRDALDRGRSEAVVALGLGASVLDDSLYSLEILPEAVKKKQRFAQRTIFNIGAAVVMIGVLVYGAMVATANKEVVKKQKRQVARAKSRAQSTHNRAENLVKRVKLQRDLVELLVQKSVPFDGSLRVMRALQDLPDDLWVESVEVVRPRGRSAVGSYGVRVKGHGKEVSGKSLDAVYSGCVAALLKRDDVGQLDHKIKKEGSQVHFEWFFDQLPEVPAKPASSEEDN